MSPLDTITSPAESVTFGNLAANRGDLPFLITRYPHATIVTLARDAGLEEALVRPQSWDWARDAHGPVIIDASRLRTLASPLCGWMVELLRACGTDGLVIRGANARVRATLHLLKLDMLITVET